MKGTSVSEHLSSATKFTVGLTPTSIVLVISDEQVFAKLVFKVTVLVPTEVHILLGLVTLELVPSLKVHK